MTRIKILAASAVVLALAASCKTADPPNESLDAQPEPWPDAPEPDAPDDPKDPTDPKDPPAVTTLAVTLQPATGVTGTQRVNFAVPFARGQLLDANQIRVLSGASELPAARRSLATYPGGSVRSVQIQVDAPAAAGASLTLRIGETPVAPSIALVPVSTTLVVADGSQGPKVWARLPAAWLAASGVTGPQVTEASVEGTNLDVFDGVCNYANNDVAKFLTLQASRDVWLYDRGTAMYRGYARRGDQTTLSSAYRETAIYRNGITGTGTATRIGVPTAVDDLKYHYNQNLAIHYLLTGDDRFRESAEDIATRVSALWSSPGYAGGDDFWTERHAGFSLLAYVWGGIVTDDKAASLRTLADTAVNAYLSVQATYPSTWTDPAARCFPHSPGSAGEGFPGSFGCSPWMSAILADALDQYATESTGAAATNARNSIVKLGTIIARDGRDTTGKPFYWMGVGAVADEVDGYDEHWGEPAYVIAMAWYHGGKTNAALKTAALELLAGVKAHGSVPHLRSFNWQCRGAIAAPFYLK